MDAAETVARLFAISGAVAILGICHWLWITTRIR